MIHISRVETDVIDTCNLRCKNCAHFSPFYKKSSYSFFEFKEDVQSLSKVMRTEAFSILGGEPLLLGNKLVDYVKVVRESQICNHLNLCTNGVLLERYEHLIPIFDSVDVNIYPSVHHDRISDWVNLKKPVYKDKLIVTYKNRFLQIFSPTQLTTEEVARTWKNCGARIDCNFLYKGKYYLCAQSIKMIESSKQVGVTYDDDGLSIHQEGLEEKLKNYIKKHKPKMCNHCRMGLNEYHDWSEI